MELSIEQKAKRYDETLERARECYFDGLSLSQPPKAIIEHLFPELKESEDEKIRKNLTSFLIAHKNSKRPTVTPTDNQIDRWISWLEKQGEQKPITHKYNVGATIYYNSFGETKSMVVANVVDIGDGNPMYEDADGSAVFEKDIVEPNPGDKVEPNFYEGEWLCENEPNNYARFIQILEIVNIQGKERYKISRDIHNDEDIVKFDFVEKHYHKFDIKDAKDGDVLCTYECGKPKIVFILKGMPKKPYVLSYHCYYNIMYPHFDNGCIAPNDLDVKPATKEQRDVLEKAMADAGYTFDFEKKELKKIEQNPAWSEEDKGIVTELIGIFESAVDGGHVSFPYRLIKDYIRVLKSCFPQNTWKPSEEQIMVLAKASETYCGIDKSVLNSLYNDLKKLREE